MPDIGYMSKLFFETTPAGGTYTEITNVKEITGPPLDVGDVQTTHLQSASAAHTHQAAMIESGEISAMVSFTGTQYATIYALIRVSRNWKVELPDSGAAIWVCDGYLKSCGVPKLGVEEEIVFPISIKLSGKPTFTA